MPLNKSKGWQLHWWNPHAQFWVVNTDLDCWVEPAFVNISISSSLNSNSSYQFKQSQCNQIYGCSKCKAFF